MFKLLTPIAGVTAYCLALLSTMLWVQPAFAVVDVNKNFNPINVTPGQLSTLTIHLYNSNSILDASAVNFTDTLPANVLIASTPNVNYSCLSNGAPVIPIGSISTAADSLSLSGGVIPMAVGTISGSCTITVDVVSNTPATYVNTIPIGAVTSSEPANTQEAKATLVVKLFSDLQVSKTFDKTVLHGGDSGNYTVTLTNPNATSFTGLGFSDSLPAQMQLANLITSNTCGGTLTDAAGGALAIGSATVKLSGGTLAAAGTVGDSCAISFAVTPSDVHAYTNGVINNLLPANSITTLEGASKGTDTLGAVMMQVSAQVTKVFNPAIITAGKLSTMTLTLNNYNLADIVNAGLIDNLPIGVTIVGTPTTTCVGGSTASSTSTSLVLTGATIPAATSAVLGGGSCTISANVTAMPITSTTYTSSIWANFLSGFAFPDVTAYLTVNTPITVTKAFSHPLNPLYFTQDRMSQTGVSTLTISLNNASVNPANISSFLDDLATMNAGIVAPAVGGISIASSPAASSNCGGALTATAGTTPIALSGGVIPANGSCTITVPIAIAGNAENGVHFWRTNTILSNALQTSEGNNTVDVSAQLGILGALGIYKSYAPTVVAAGGISRLTVSVYRVEGASPLSNVGVIDNLPIGHSVAASPNISNNCGGAVVATPGANSFSLVGGSLPATPGNASITCTFAVDVQAPNTVGSDTNTINYNTVTTAEGVTNMNTLATASLTRVVLPSVTLNQSFSPTSINGGNMSRLDITIANTTAGAVNLSNASLTDNLPAGTEIAANPSPTFTGGAACTQGTITAVPRSTQLHLSGAAVGAFATCILSVNVTSTVGGNHINSLAAGSFTSEEGSSNNNAPSATLNVLQNANVGIVFSPAQLEAGNIATMTLIVYNSNTFNLNGALSNALTNTLPVGMTVAAGAISTTCSGGALTAPVGGNSVRLDGGIFPASSSCIITIPVTAIGGVIYTNAIPIGAIATTQGASNPDPTNATLTVIAKPNSMWKYFAPASIGVGENSVLNLSLTNPNPAALLPSGFSNVSFTDVLPAGMSIAFPQSAIYSCAGAANSFSAGQTTLNFTGLTIPPATTCYLSVIVTTNAIGVFNNTASGISTGQTQTAGAVSNTATLTVLKRVQVTKNFLPTTIAPNGVSTLTITLSNPNSADAISLAGLTDTFPAGLTLASPLVSSSNCAGATLFNATGGVLAAGNNGVRIQSGSIPANSSCTISVAVTASVLGNYLNITGLLATSNAGSSLTGGTATLAVNTPTQLSVLKSVAVISDPVNGTTNPKFIPGAIAEYTITVSNAGSAPDSDSIIIDDVIPAHTSLLFSDINGASSGPVAFVQGTPSSTLSYSYPTDLKFSNNYGASFVYAPSAGCDAQVTSLKMHPKGIFVGNATPPHPSFQLKFRVCVN